MERGHDFAQLSPSSYDGRRIHTEHCASAKSARTTELAPTTD
jgi:hypothetical protein